MNAARQEWEKLFQPLPGGEEILARILESYRAPGRHYHTLEHIAEMTALLAEYRGEFSPWDDVLFACLYHDIVYDATRSDNEELSARRAEEELGRLKIPALQIRHIREFILATRKHQLSEDSAALKFFLDADLAILGAAATRYERYAADVRQEYAHVPDVDYCAGRSAVLKKFLARPSLYFSDQLRSRFEEKARENIAREIQTLSG